MNSNNYNSLIKLAAAPVVNPSTGGTRLPTFGGFAGGPGEQSSDLLQRTGLPMTPASSGKVSPLTLAEAETQRDKIQSAESENQIGKEKNRQNLDAYFARLTALNDTNKAAGRPAYNMTALDLYAPNINRGQKEEMRQAQHRIWRDQVLSSTAQAAAAKGTPYNPAELNRLRQSLPTPYQYSARSNHALDEGLSVLNANKYTAFGPGGFRPQWNSQIANFDSASAPFTPLHKLMEQLKEK